MKTIILKFLGLALILTAFMACSDDDDSTPIINDVMVVYNSETGVFSSINITNGALTTLGTVTLNNEVVVGLRDIVYNPSNKTVYASSRANDPYSGIIYSINPATLEATIINDNADEDWYALPGLEMAGGKLLATVYWDYYDPSYDESTGLLYLNLDGSFSSTFALMYQGDSFYFSDGMGIEYGSSNNQLLITDGNDILISDLNGNISEIIELTGTGFPNMDELDDVRTIETDADGTIYGIDGDGHFGSVNLTTGVFTYIATLPGERIMALSMIPETVFD